MSGSEHPTEWYLARDGQQFGPLSDVELTKFVELGHLRPTDLLWRQGFADWQPAVSIFPPQRPGSAAPLQSPPAARRLPELTERVHGDPRTAPGGSVGGERTPARTASPVRSGGRPAQGEPRQRRPSAAQPTLQAGPDVASSRTPARRRTRFPWAGAIFCLGFAALAGVGLMLHQSGNLSAVMADFGLQDMTTGSTAKKVETPRGSVMPAVQQRQAAVDESLKRSPLQGFGSSTSEVDASFQQSPLWRLLKKEFPDWYTEQVKDAVRLRGEQKDDKAIAQHLAEALVALRRKHVTEALSAAPPRLKVVASTFLDNLGRLASQSIDACYGFISQGETSPMVVELFRASEHTPHLQAQVVAVFEAIVEGRKAPRTHPAPKREDYDALAAQLAQRGWNPADLQLFSDARALSRAPPQKVCQMVQDWFAAQLSVKDEEVQMRLLVEALKPVVAG